MPPQDSGHALTPEQIALPDAAGSTKGPNGARTGPSRRPSTSTAGRSAAADWVRNPIDQFILARLDDGRAAAVAEADKVTLLRRVTLDLTGLPPTPAEVDAFLADTSPDAYEKARRRAARSSPHYGERMAVPLARRRPLRRHARLPHRQPPRRCGRGATG